LFSSGASVHRNYPDNSTGVGQIPANPYRCTHLRAGAYVVSEEGQLVGWTGKDVPSRFPFGSGIAGTTQIVVKLAPCARGPGREAAKEIEMRHGHHNVSKRPHGRVPTSRQTRWRCSTCGQVFEGERRKNCGNCTFTREEGLLKGLRHSADSIRAQRRRLGISAEDYGKLVGVSGATIRNWERGGKRPLKFNLLGVWRVRRMKKMEALKFLTTLKADGC